MEGDRCRDLQPFFPAYAADRTEEVVNGRIRLHLGEGCPGCAAEIEALMEAFHAVPLALAVQPFDSDRAADLVAQAKALKQEEVEVPILFPEANQVRLWRVLTALSAAAVIATVIWAQSTKDASSEMLAATQVASQQLRQLQQTTQQRDILAASLESAADPAARVLQLQGPTPARAFVDTEGGAVVLSMDPPGSPGGGQLLTVWATGVTTVWLASLPPGYALQGGQIRIPVLGPIEGDLLITAEPSGPRPSEPAGPVLYTSASE